MATIKKPSKALVNEKAEKDVEKVRDALENKGAVLNVRTFSNRTEYGVEYKEGGFFKITKTMYDKFNK